MVAGRSFQVHHNGSDFEVNYLSDFGLQGFKDELFRLTHIPPDEQKIMGADEDRIISCESDLLAVISGELRLVSASGNDGLLSSDEEEAGMLQETDKQPDNRGLKGKGLAHLTPTVKSVMEGPLTLSNSQHSADQFQPLELEKYRLVNQPSCDGSGNDTMGHGMRAATLSEILHGRYGDKIHGKITNFLRKCLLLEGPGVNHIKELELFQQDHRRYIYSLISICFCDNLDNEIRDIAGLCLKNELKDADGLVNPCLMDFMKTKLVAIISSPRDCVPHSTCQIISQLAGVAGKKSEEWRELTELIELSLHNEQLLTPAALETFGYVSVEGLALGKTTVGKIHEVLARGMNLKNNDSVCLAATKAMCYTLSNVAPHLVCKMGIILEAILEAAGSSNLNIKQAAFECLIVLPSRFYMNLAICPSHLKKILEFTAVAVKEGKKDDAVRAVQFWSYLFETQINMLKTNSGVCSFYPYYLINLKDLITLLLSLSDMEEIEKASEFDRKTLRLCVGNLAIAVGEHHKSFANAVELFIDANSTARHKYMAKVINSTMGAVVSDIFGEEEAGKEGKAENEMERGEGSQKPEIPEKKKELDLWKGLLLARMTSIFEVLLKQDCGFLCKTVTETISTYPHHHLISNPAELMRGVCKNYFESAFSYLRETHGENLLGTFRKSWGTHLCMIQLLKLFFSVCGCHSKYLETWVLLLVFPKITDTVTELIDLASNGDKQMDKKIVESVTQILMDHGLGEAYKNNINGASRCAESIAMYCENLLKKDVSDEEMEKQLDMVSVVSKFYFGIDHFTGFYIKRVCRRIHDVDWSKESRMLTMVRRTLFGGEEKYTSSLKNMEHIVNFIVSGQNEDKQKFGEYLVNNAIMHGEMVMNLATAPHCWSFKDASFKNIKLPQEFVNMIEVTTEFFQNTPRPLQYTPEQIRPRKFVQINYPLSSCTVECMLGTERIELDMSVTQATLLKLFDTVDTWIFSEILTELRISHEELVSLIQSLSQENNKLLIKVPSTENILPTDCFELNTYFTYTSPIPRPVLEDSRRRNVVERVDNDMIGCTIRCVLMKIMKPSKGLRPMDREKLAGAAIEKCAGLEKCGFVPTRAAVEVSIASLTKDEYLLVDKNDNNMLWWNEE